jgi:hypothetical protein
MTVSPDTGERDRQVYTTSSEAFSLAQAFVTGQGQMELESRAQQLNELLDRQWASLEDQPSDDPGVTRAWSDARLDVGYVLSQGELPTSPRLNQFINER